MWLFSLHTLNLLHFLFDHLLCHLLDNHWIQHLMHSSFHVSNRGILLLKSWLDQLDKMVWRLRDLALKSATLVMHVTLEVCQVAIPLRLLLALLHWAGNQDWANIFIEFLFTYNFDTFEDQFSFSQEDLLCSSFHDLLIDISNDGNQEVEEDDCVWEDNDQPKEPYDNLRQRRQFSIWIYFKVTKRGANHEEYVC